MNEHLLEVISVATKVTGSQQLHRFRLTLRTRWKTTERNARKLVGSRILVGDHYLEPRVVAPALLE